MSWIASGQTYTISTVAGGALPVNIPGTSASLDIPSSLAVDKTGNIFFADITEHVVLRLNAATGVLTLVAGNGAYGFSGDNGPAASAQLSQPRGVAVDSAGNLYIADSANHRIRKVSGGVITTVAGNGNFGFSGDNGPATGAQLYLPWGVAVDSTGSVYIADYGNNRIRKVANGVITTVAGNGTGGFGGDNGAATSAQLNQPRAVAVDSADNLYLGDTSNSRIRKVSSGVITTVAGNGTAGFGGDNGPATGAQLFFPSGVAVDSSGNLYIADASNSRIRKVTNGVITTAAGNGTIGFSGDNGPATSAQLGQPLGIAVDDAGNLYIATYLTGRIRKVSGGVITTLAGNGLVGDNGPATSSQLNYPWGVAVDVAGNLYIADMENSRIRKVSGGVITTTVGNGAPGFSGDSGPATSAPLAFPQGVAVDSSANLYIADTSNNRIRMVANGVITTVAGNGPPGFSGDNGPATTAQLNFPVAISVDSSGNLYIADTNNNRIRRVANGVITTVAGNGTPGFSGDNGPATSSQMNNPSGVAVDSNGNVYFADSANRRIRKVANGVITTVAGGGTSFGDNGPATSAQLSGPTGVALDSAGNLYIADTNSRIRKVANGVMTTVAGNGTRGFSGDNGPATSAALDQPYGVAVDPAGKVYFADSWNNRVRLLTPALSINPGGVVNAASSAAGAPVAPGSIATVYGSFLISSLSQATSSPLPVNLGGLSMQFGSGLSVPLFFASGGQVNFQVPWELAGQSRTSLSVTVNGQTSATQTINLAPFAPGIFSQVGGQGAILDTSYRLVDSSNPATAGGTILQIYCTGMGAVTNQPPSGSPSGDQLSQTTTTPTVTIGGVQAQVLFSGLAPGSVGEYQVDALVPAGSSKGAAVPVVIAVGGVTSNAVTIAVQ
ncbi:MAG TPA: hypothetical protein VNY05_29475 [Candidatus Acidoferrales bacterium]|nr:hypothetical protein [Candidatus Acidoferrales bacterium]